LKAVIQSKGDTRLQAENITVKGSQISSEQGSTILSAQQKIDISEGRKLSDAETAYKTKDKSTFSTTTEKGRVRNMSDEAIASSIDGKNVILDAKNIDIRGSNVVSDELTQIQAKENININAAENQYLNESEKSVKKSGFTSSFSDGVASVGYGKSSNQNKQNNQSTTLTQSQIVSLQGNTNILAGKDLTAEAAILGAGKDLNLQGANVNLNAGYETANQHSESQSKSSGISVGVTYSPIAAAASTYKKNAESDQYSDSAVGKVMSRADAIDKATQAATTPIVVTAGSHKSNQTSDYAKTSAVVTQASAQGNLNIIATEGNINSQGAQLSAEGDALLHAKDSINLSYATDKEQQTANSQQSGFSIDNRNKFAPAGVYNNKNQGNGNIDKVTGTQLSSGGKTRLQTETGDINILGSSVAAMGDVNINAARDVNIKSTQNSQSQSESSSNKGIGSAQISDTEQFYGYMKGQSQSSSNGIEQQRSQVGSLEGNVNIIVGNNYNQQVADVVAKKDINIDAKQINLLEDHNIGSSSQSSDDLKVGIFKRISSPILDLLGAGDKVANSKGDDRTQALQGLAVGAQAYQSYSDIKGGALAKAEAGIGFSTSENQQTSSYATSQQNKINAGGNVNLTSTEGNIHLQNTQVKAGDTIQLDSAKDILLESGQSQEKAKGSNSNAGLSVGYGASVGAQTGVYIYGEAGYGKGSNHTDNNTHSQTTLDSDKLILKSKGDTTLNGATAKANRIDADVGGKLSIISQQDNIDQSTKQTGIGGRVQASLGTAWQVSGNYSNSEANGKSNSVNQQSGLFAGEGGYHVKADSVDLKGGAIVSTATKDKNDLTANNLTFSNIENQSAYDATSVALSGGTKVGQHTGNGDVPQPTSNENWRNSTTFSPSLPQHESDKDSSTTYATLSAGNITISDKQTTVEQLGIHSDAATANRKVDTLPNLQDILDQQKTVADATSTIVAATRTYNQNQQKEAEQQKSVEKQKVIDEISKNEVALNYYQKLDAAHQEEYLNQYSPDYALASQSNKDWGMGGDKSRAVNAVTLAITGALGGQTDLQVASNALAPYAAQVIGQQFGHGEDKNTAAQMVSHAILGATLAYVNGGNPAAGGSAAVASEAAATYFTNQYKDDARYQNEKGEFIPNLLPEDVKTQIRDLTAAIGAVAGGTVGDSAFNAQIAGVVGQNAVENNSIQDIALARAEGKTLAQKAEDFVNEQNKQYKQKNCAGMTATACSAQMYKQRQEFLKGGGSLTLDFIPIIGDIKGFHEAQDFGDYFFASVGLIPIVGDAAKSYHKAEKAYDIAEKARDVAGMKAAMNDAVQACTGGACFTAGTLIETDRGLKAVEQFEGGELIWSRNDVTLEYGYRPVIATKVTAEQAIFEVVIQNKTGQQEILETTAEHPFWIKDFGWLKASLLQSGMTLLDRNNEELTIVSQALIPNKVETVYNIEVDGFHTYHVGELGTWVHNANCCEIKAPNSPIKPPTQTPSTITKIDAKYVNLKSGQKGDWNKIANKPEANTIYKLDNGYTYKTDANGRVNNVEANLKLEANDRNNYQQKNSGKNNGRLPDDHGGHLIASMFKGPGEGINIVPMDKTFNGGGGEWGKLEKTWQDALKQNKEVKVLIQPIYSGTSKRPTEFRVIESINGIQSKPQILKNTATGK
jgi:filamentous hemagglutinin